MKKIILFLLISFSLFSASALTYDNCNYSDVSRMKSIVTNINLSYDYKIINNEARFQITLNNLTEDIYFYDTTTGINYYYSDTNNGEIVIFDYKVISGSYKFYSAKSECYGISLGAKYYKFPIYNKYYNSPLCADIPNYSLCQKWGYVNYSQDEFEDIIFEYKNSKPIEEDNKINVQPEKTFFEKVIYLYVNYYYYFLGVLILLCSVIIIINNRKNNFKL